MTNEQTETVKRFFRALSAFDASAMAALMTEEGSIKSAGAPVYHGPEAALRAIGDLSRSNTAWEAEPVRILDAGDTAVVEWTSLVTEFGGGQNRLDGCAVLDFAGDQIRSARLYWRPEDMHS